ncbi:MAG: biopolymer transporter ExbD [Deltaproteobacteria bacterium]|nr:biopolymer transporter ExbD [Deltaproteobacteria bacterium]
MKRRPASTDQPLNVTPLIDILSNIVFFLMLSISFVHLRMVSASITQASDSNDLDTETALTVTVMMGDYGYRANARDPQKKPTEGGEEKKDFPKVGDKWDNDGLAAWLRGIKLRAPKSDSVIITPEPSVPLSRVVDAMDHCREAPVQGGGGMMPTFPKVVLSSLVK